MTRARRVAIIVDHPGRDLSSAVWISVELARRGIEAALVPMYFQESEIFALAPDLVLINYLRPTNQAMIDKFIACNIRFALLDTEGGFFGDLRHYEQTLPGNRTHYDAMSAVLAWGERMRRFWIEDIGLPAAKVHVTGQPRFDFYASEYHAVLRRFLPPRFRYGTRPLVLMNTKVSVANPRFLSPKREFDLYVNRLKLPRDAVERHLRIGRESIVHACEIAQALAASLPEADVVIRPHPHERAQTYADKCEPRPNLLVHQEGEVAPWITRSAVLLQRHCTTAIEAALAGVPVVSPQWWPTSAFLPDADALSYSPSTLEEMRALVKAACTQGLEPCAHGRAELARIVEEWLYRIDGGSAARVAAAIEGMLPTKRAVDVSRARALAHAEFAGRAGLKVKLHDLGAQFAQRAGIARIFAIAERVRRARWRRSGKGYTEDEVSAYVHALARPGERMAVRCSDERLFDDTLLTAVEIFAGAATQ